MEGRGGEGPHQLLSHVVDDASVYTPLTQPGPLQPPHLLPPFSSELVLVSLPDTVNPMKLINSELVIGGRRDSLLQAGKQRYRVTTYPAGQDTTCLPSLFLPDQDGRLTKVPSDMKAFLVVKGEVEERKDDEENRVDIEALRSAPCKLPRDLRRRDFLGGSWRVEEALAENIHPTKRKKKSVRNLPPPDASGPPSGEDHSPKKKKKKKRMEPLSPHVNTSGSPASHKEKNQVLSQADELAGQIKKTIKKEKL